MHQTGRLLAPGILACAAKSKEDGAHLFPKFCIDIGTLGHPERAEIPREET